MRSRKNPPIVSVAAIRSDVNSSACNILIAAEHVEGFSDMMMEIEATLTIKIDCACCESSCCASDNLYLWL